MLLHARSAGKNGVAPARFQWLDRQFSRGLVSSFEFLFDMGSLKKRRKAKISKHKRRKRMRANRHKKRLRYKA
jgi:hypothetical protein